MLNWQVSVNKGQLWSIQSVPTPGDKEGLQVNNCLQFSWQYLQKWLTSTFFLQL